MDGILPINKTSLHAAWRGQAINPNALYEEWSLWIFSADGELLFDEKTEVTPPPR